MICDSGTPVRRLLIQFKWEAHQAARVSDRPPKDVRNEAYATAARSDALVAYIRLGARNQPDRGMKWPEVFVTHLRKISFVIVRT